MSINILNASDASFHDFYSPGTMFKLTYAGPQNRLRAPITLILMLTNRKGLDIAYNLFALDNFNRWEDEQIWTHNLSYISHTQLLAYLRGRDPVPDDCTLRVLNYVSPEAYAESLLRRITEYCGPETEI